MEVTDNVGNPDLASTDEAERTSKWLKQCNDLSLDFKLPGFTIEVECERWTPSKPKCSSVRCKLPLPAMGYRISLAALMPYIYEGKSFASTRFCMSYRCPGIPTIKMTRHGYFHVKCIEEMLDLSSPAVLPHIVFGDNPEDKYQLDLGALEILKAWYNQCAMDDVTSGGIKKVPAHKYPLEIESSVGDLPSTPSAFQTTDSAPDAYEWEGQALVPLSTLERKENTIGNNDGSWCSNTDSLFAPWAEKIANNDLPRLPIDGGFILEKDVLSHTGKPPIRDKENKVWHILKYLPSPALWRERHTLSESLDRWNGDKVGQ